MQENMGRNGEFFKKQLRDPNYACGAAKLYRTPRLGASWEPLGASWAGSSVEGVGVLTM